MAVIPGSPEQRSNMKEVVEETLTPLQRLRIQLTELKYWQVTRRTRKFVPWLAKHLPNGLKYFVVVHGMVTVEPSNDPSKVSGMQLLELWGKKGER
jgi:hypothetical protein